MNGLRVYKAAVAALVMGSVVAACSGGQEATTPQVVSGIGSKPDRVTHTWNLGSTQATATAVNLMSLQLTVNGSQGSVSLNGATACGATGQVPSNLCPGVTYRPITFMPANPTTLTMTAATLYTACTAPAGAPTPAPASAAACYVVAYEGGVGPYIIQGPATATAGGLSIPAEATVLNFNGNTGYDFFLAYVTNESAAPPPPTATPSAPPTGPGAPTPTVAPTPTAVPTACPTTSSWGYEDDARHRMDGGNDGDEGGATGCCRGSYSGDQWGGDTRHRSFVTTPTPAPSQSPVAACSPCPSDEESARHTMDEGSSCYGSPGDPTPKPKPKHTETPCQHKSKHHCN